LRNGGSIPRFKLPSIQPIGHSTILLSHLQPLYQPFNHHHCINQLTKPFSFLLKRQKLELTEMLSAPAQITIMDEVRFLWEKVSAKVSRL